MLSMPLQAYSRVDFPEPEGPMTEINSPSSTDMSTPSNTRLFFPALSKCLYDAFSADDFFHLLFLLCQMASNLYFF